MISASSVAALHDKLVLFRVHLHLQLVLFRVHLHLQLVLFRVHLHLQLGDGVVRPQQSAVHDECRWPLVHVSVS